MNLKPTASSHIDVVQQPLGSYTGYEVADAAPHRVIAVTPHFEKQFDACPPHDLPATPAAEQSPVVYTSQLQAAAGVPMGKLVASIDGFPSAGGTAIQWDVFDPQEPIAPALSTVGAAGIAAAYAIRVAPDNTQTILPVFTAQGSTITPAPLDLSQPGSVYLLLFGTGFDAAAVASTVVNIQGVPVTVQYAGTQLSFAGFDQIGVLLPPSLTGGGLVSVQATIGGVPANRVFIDIQ